MKSLPICLLALSGAIASPAVLAKDGHHTLRVSFAKSSETDFLTVVLGDYSASRESNYLLGANWGTDFTDTLFGLPFPTTLNVGLQYFNERGIQQDGYGTTAYIKAHYDWTLPFTEKQIRLGLGEGLSYVSRIPMSEQRDFAKKGEGIHSEKLMNYLEWTIDVPLSQFEPMRRLMNGRIEELSVGFIVYHRSSVFGLFAETKGGINFMGFGFEARY
jgi:hypothetical protein